MISSLVTVALIAAAFVPIPGTDASQSLPKPPTTGTECPFNIQGDLSKNDCILQDAHNRFKTIAKNITPMPTVQGLKIFASTNDKLEASPSGACSLDPTMINAAMTKFTSNPKNTGAPATAYTGLAGLYDKSGNADQMSKQVTHYSITVGQRCSAKKVNTQGDRCFLLKISRKDARDSSMKSTHDATIAGGAADTSVTPTSPPLLIPTLGPAPDKKWLLNLYDRFVANKPPAKCGMKVVAEGPKNIIVKFPHAKRTFCVTEIKDAIATFKLRHGAVPIKVNTVISGILDYRTPAVVARPSPMKTIRYTIAVGNGCDKTGKQGTDKCLKIRLVPKP